MTDGVPPDLAAALAWWGDGTEPKTMAEAVEKARSYRNDAHELADVSFELRNQPEGNPAEQVRRLLAPVTDAEVEAAIAGVVDAVRHDAQMRLHGKHSEEFVAERTDKLRNVIARRVAEARGAGLMELRAWVQMTASTELFGKETRPMAWLVSPNDMLAEIDRLLAAPAASKLAEEPAQEDDGPCLSALLANMRMEMSDGANGMRTSREEAIAAVVECVARRIEALERAAQGGGQ